MAKESASAKFSIVHPQAAGIDVGSRFHWVSVGQEAGESKQFGVFTKDLHALCQWLVSLGIRTVAMESTGFYWKQLFVMLQSYGMEVYLVNASFTKNIQGRKPSDLSDSQWIWKMHSVGLLPASFQPDSFTEELRTYVRHRNRLIEGAAQCVNRMQKCLTLMNLQLPIVVSDISGKSGKAIIEAILNGERDGSKLAQLADYRLKADKATLSEALTGFWRADHLFELDQHWKMYHHYQEHLAQCDQKIEEVLQSRVQVTGQAELAYDQKKSRGKNDPSFQLATYAYQLSDGVDLLQVDGVGLNLILTLLSEVGLDLTQFPSAKHFTSWLCLCPNKKVSGGKVLSSSTRKNKSRLRKAFKQTAIGVCRKKDCVLAHFYRKMAAKHGKGTAITATARKIAVIVYHMLQKKEAYQPQQLEDYQQKVRTQKIKQIQRTIRNLEVHEHELVFA
ncbi:IS110 family transposase [Haliscomenobacter hydrossis]|uniref:Transposase IS116/IS110/IS902 family protein n=1 Tax=Haliscomenobacter hydrossis (strain ATCC 27775 / DSM 1100 / LMG 10767 / O) TaxID=760192 RepID=F4KUU7_HALH1|nr:IS110 family transposase [Haliscomenobacter hydrossis]AEE48123.1 transposase IS116/IS110/IS902 family protein [Haliscomenobacter hydrossis DSM 1100]AEE49175.1 transposase IS116/IS110/IS902 family protein [Haliscomenobacter hydrossis DSM 1100]